MIKNGELYCQHNHYIFKYNIAYLIYDYDFTSNPDDKICDIYCEVCMFEDFDDYDLRRYLRILYGITDYEVLSTIKPNNNNKVVLEDHTYSKYVINKFKLDTKKLLEEVEKEFVDYELFQNFLEENY